MFIVQVKGRVNELQALQWVIHSEKENSLWNARIYSDEFYDLHSPPNIIQLIKSRRMRCVGHVAHTGDRRWGMHCVWGTDDGACTVYRGQKMEHLLCMGDRQWGMYCVWGTEDGACTVYGGEKRSI